MVTPVCASWKRRRNVRHQRWFATGTDRLDVLARPSHYTAFVARRSPSQSQNVIPDLDPVRRALRLRRRGQARKAWLLLREACQRQASDARLWTLYGVECARLGKRDCAEKALGQAVWLRQRARQTARARTTQGLLERLRLVA